MADSWRSARDWRYIDGTWTQIIYNTDGTYVDGICIYTNKCSREWDSRDN